MPENTEKLMEIESKDGKVGGCISVMDSNCYNPRLIEFLATAFPIRNVCDLGCGYGQAARQFASLGCNVVGVEFLDYAAGRCHFPVVLHDMEVAPIILRGIDLMYSIEFVEHVSVVENTVETLCQAKMIAISHAVPGQPGHHHVSCFDDSVWIEKIIQRGFSYLPRWTTFARGLCGEGFFAKSGLIFVRNDMVSGWCPEEEIISREN